MIYGQNTHISVEYLPHRRDDLKQMWAVAILNHLDSADTQVDHKRRVVFRLLAASTIYQQLALDLKVLSGPSGHDALVALFEQVS